MTEQTFRTSWIVRAALSLLSVVPAAALWDSVTLPYRNPHHIVGILSQQAFNPTTNVVRFALFVLLPSFTWILSGRLLNARDVRWPAEPARRDGREAWSSLALATVTGLGFVWAVFQSVHCVLTETSSVYLDLFHDGDFLAPAFQWAARGHLWTGNYLTHGAFTDVIAPWLGWVLFGRETIGASKAFLILLDAAISPGLWLLVVCLQYALRPVATRLDRAILVAAILSILCLGQQSAAVDFFLSRSLSVFLCLGALAVAFKTTRKGWFFAAGTLTVAALFTSTDGGMYGAAASVMAIVVFAWGPRVREHVRRELLPWMAGYIVGHFAVLIAFGTAEYLAWMRQIVSAEVRWAYIYAYIYPSPWLHSARVTYVWASHTGPLVVLSLVLLVFTMTLSLYRADPRMRTAGQIHLLVAGIAFFAYRTALGRSDVEHLAEGMAYSCFGLGFSLWLFARLTSVKAQWCVLALACGPLLASIGWFTVHDGFGQVAGASTRVHAFADIPDSQFLNEQERNAQQELLPIFKGEPCLFVFPNEPAWYYLLQKPACNRFYFTVHAEGDDDQREVVRALAGAAPRYIVYSSPISREVDEIPNSTRLPTLTAWLTEHYAPFRSVAGWQIYQRK